tara:strand:+ start:4554 stop:5087 length:534 start_codon:yes stop_codon:yes gene_type:complete
MKIINTPMEGLFVIQPEIFEDERGFFLESFNKQRFGKNRIKDEFVQDNISRSYKNVIRGMHFRTKKPQSQLVTVLNGCIFDVCVDLRKESKSFGKWYGIELSKDGPRQIYMEPGFAHGFLCLSEFVDMHYKVSELFESNNEAGFVYDDQDISIDWPISNPILSTKDAELPSFRDSLL